MSAVLRRFSLLLVSQGLAAAGQLAAGVVVARSLGPEEFGHWSYALAYGSVVASVVDFGMSFSVLRDLSRRPEDTARYLGNVMAIKVALSLSAFLAIVALLPALGGGQAQWAVTLLLGAQVIFASFTTLMATALYAREGMFLSAAVRGGQGMLLAGAVLLFSLAGPGLLPFAYVYAGVGAVGAVAAAALVVARLPGVLPRVDPAFWRSYLRDLSPLAAAIVLTTVYYSADTLMLGLAGLDREVGWYGAAYRTIYALLLLVGALNQAFLPDQSRALDGGGLRSPDSVRSYYQLVWVLAVPVVVLGPIAGPQAMSLVYGAEYEGGARALQVLLLAGGLMFFSSFFSSLVLLAGRQREYLGGVALGAGTNIALNLVLIPLYTLNGAAVATVVSEALVMLWMRQRSRRLLPNATCQVAWLVPATGLLTGGAAVLLLLAGVPALLAVGAAFGMYGAVMLLSGQLRSMSLVTPSAPGSPATQDALLSRRAA